jgi:phospholipid/cholesterol/gamma-HCH transport system substrate-binding protein
MLLERNQALIGTIVAILIGIGTVFAVGATGGLFVPGERYQADFPDAAGLEDGNFVFQAGVRIGQVTDVELLEDRVRVTFSSEAPPFASDATADIIISNTLGKRAVRINAGTSDEKVEPGFRIPLEGNGTPVDLPELGDESAELLTELDVDALQELTTALADIADTSNEDLGRLLVGIEDVADILVDRRTELRDLLQEGTVLIDSVNEVDQDIIRIIDAFGSTLDRLDRRRGDVQRLLNETVSATDTANRLLIDREDQIDRILQDLHTDLEIVDAHQVDLAHVFAYLGSGLEGFASIGYQGGDAKFDNPTWGNVFASELGEAGVDLLLGCGGTLDEIFTDALGPDPNCDTDTEAAADVIRPATSEQVWRRADASVFFELGGAR